MRCRRLLGRLQPAERGSPITIRVDDVWKSYRRKQALQGISVEFGPGVTVVLGQNGAGKSTLVRSLVGIERPSSGGIVYDVAGSDLTTREMQRHTGWLPQSFGYPGRMRTREFVRYAAWLKESDTDDSTVDAALTFADVLEVGNERLGSLSVGTLRRVGLAVSVVHKPFVLVLDEPTAGLDPMQRSTFHQRIRSLTDDVTIVLATHLLEDVQALAGQLVLVDEGRVVWSGSVSELTDKGDAQLDGTDRLRSGFVSIVQGARE